jgi:hypothetical protein
VVAVTVLVVSWTGDNAAPDRVLAALDARGADAARLDTDRFPGAAQLDLDPRTGAGPPRPARPDPRARRPLGDVDSAPRHSPATCRTTGPPG